MRVIAHRGWWLKPEEKNSAVALERAFRAGFGVETDLRDLAGQVVISHDPPLAGALPLSALLDLHTELGPGLPLALNIKADGLLALLDDQAPALAERDHFFFDMAVPDMLSYVRAGRPVYARHSEIEPLPALLDDCSGVWLDAFYGDWFCAQDVAALLAADTQVCLVSPELHGRDHRRLWREVVAPLARETGLLLCTDFPQAAREAFGS